MKPNAPSDYRGLFSPISTNVPGLDVCELLPLHARIADKFNLIRSIHHGFADHGGGHKRFLTGQKPATPTGFVNDKPCVGSMASLFFSETPVHDWNTAARSDREAFQRFFWGMLDRGFYLAPSPFEALFLSAAHTGADVVDTLEAASEVLEDVFGEGDQ